MFQFLFANSFATVYLVAFLTFVIGNPTFEYFTGIFFFSLGCFLTPFYWQIRTSCHVYKFYFLSRAIRHPASGYVQGINDLVTPFLVVFLSEYLEGSVDNWSISDLPPEKISDIEADCYWCLSKLLDGMQDHYTFAQPGIQRLVFKLKELVRRIDGKPIFWHFLLLIYATSDEPSHIYSFK